MSCYLIAGCHRNRGMVGCLRISRHKEFISTYSGLAKGDAGKSWSAYSDFIVGEIKKDASKFSKKRPIREYLDGNEEEYDFSK